MQGVNTCSALHRKPAWTLEGFKNDLFAIGFFQGHRLLDHHMLFVLQTDQCVLSMKPIGCCHTKDFKVKPEIEQLLDSIEKGTL